jgi:DNA-directed RNA polymerase I, II, and III subunit RPABC1
MEIATIYKVRKTLIELLTDRGYNMNPIDNVVLEDFTVMYEENNYDVVDVDKKIVGFFFKESKTFGKKDLDNVIDTILTTYDEDIHIIIVLKDKYNITIEKELANDIYKNVEIFLFKELYINITKHTLVPKHIPLSQEEITNVLKKYNLTKSQLPKISTKDPLTHYYGLKSGDMFKIIRSSSSSGQYITYRVVR